MSPERIQLRRTTGWRKPDHALVVARPTIWGNPISLSDVGQQYPSLNDLQVATMVVRQFEDLVRAGTISLPNWRFADGRRGPVTWTYPSTADIRAALAGRSLACWCPLDEPCHADVLLRVANGGPV